MLPGICEAFRKQMLEFIGRLPLYALDQIWKHRGYDGLYIFRDQVGPLRVGQAKNLGARMSSQKYWIKDAAVIERACRENMSLDSEEKGLVDVAKRAKLFLAAKGIYPEVSFSVLAAKEVQDAGMTLNTAEGLIQWAIRPILNVKSEQTLLLRQNELRPTLWESCCSCQCHYTNSEYCKDCTGFHISALRMDLKEAMSVIDAVSPRE